MPYAVWALTNRGLLILIFMVMWSSRNPMLF